MIKSEEEKIKAESSVVNESFKNGVMSNVDGVKREQPEHETSTITGVQMIKDILEKIQNLPQGVSVDYGENKSLFISAIIDNNRTIKFEFRDIDESFPTIVLEKFLEPFCKKIAEIAENKKSEPDNLKLKFTLTSAINKTITETGLSYVGYLFDSHTELIDTGSLKEENGPKADKDLSSVKPLNSESTISEKRILEEPTLPAGAIGFYKIGDEFGIFSNFAHTPVEIDGHTWFTTEHYYQSWKFRGVDEPASLRAVQRILTKKSPVEAAKLGRDKSIPRRPEWKSLKDDAMRVAVACKAKQHEEMRENLLKTGDALIVEKAITDSYWGYGPDGNGKNMLGHVLMEVREAIKEGRLDQYILEARKRLPEA